MCWSRLLSDCARGLQSLHLSTDDTPIQVLDTAHPKGIKRGHIWSFFSDDKIVFFEYTPNWHGAHVQELLKDFQGTLQSDGYAGLGGLFQQKLPADAVALSPQSFAADAHTYLEPMIVLRAQNRTHRALSESEQRADHASAAAHSRACPIH